MRTHKHFQYTKHYPKHDQLNFICNWDQFNDDPRTKDVDLHLGASIDFSKLDPSKINIHMWGEWPNCWFGGKTRGQCVTHNEEIERRFDYIAAYCHMTNDGRKEFGNYIFIPTPFDVDFANYQLGFDMSKVDKEIDVFMCAGTGGSELKASSEGFHPVELWYEVMKDFNHRFCNQSWPTHFVRSWHEKQRYSAQSKISVVFTSFVGSTPQCRTYAGQNFPWIKFIKKPNDLDNVKSVTTAPKYRICDAALCKSIMLCYNDTFCDETPPWKSAIESVHGLLPGVDFIYFENSEDLRSKIRMILDDYDNPKYQNMVDSAYDKTVALCDLTRVYERYLLPLAKQGKTR